MSRIKLLNLQNERKVGIDSSRHICRIKHETLARDSCTRLLHETNGERTANSNEYRTFKDITKRLQVHFLASKTPLSLPPESRTLLQAYVEEKSGGDANKDEAARANQELKAFWEKHVGTGPEKLAVFVGVLRELRQTIVGEANILEWWQLAVKPVINSTKFGKEAIENARDFLLGVMGRIEDDENAHKFANTTNRLLSDLLAIYIDRTRTLHEDHDEGVAQINSQIAKQVEDILVAFGRKCPKQFFYHLDDLLGPASTRLQALTLLSSFLVHQAPHLYLVINTPLMESLLKCLMNDTSVTVISVALSCLIMLLPHIPGSLVPHLPRLFLIYSRLLCWEKFSSLSTEAEKSLVTDDRLPSNNIESTQNATNIGIDANWEKAQPLDGVIEAETPELMTYFTYLYGLYPLNFMNYIRKPRRYLKSIDFPGADTFDLDQTVIRSRTDQFRQVHLLHPNFYNSSAEEEPDDPKWPKMDPADVVGECHSLRIDSMTTLRASGSSPLNKLSEPLSVIPLRTASIKTGGQLSPAMSHASLRSLSSWRGTQSTAVSATAGEPDSPLLKPHLRPLHHGPVSDQSQVPSRDGDLAGQTTQRAESHTHPVSFDTIRSPVEEADPSTLTNLAYLQREIAHLRNDLNFERWHKTQYSEHISQIMRRNVKEATREAETLNLINANRALKKQLDQVSKAREATVKDSALTRKQANSLEANMTERFQKLKHEQEVWQSDADELKRLRLEMKQYRDLLVAAEARELKASHQLEIAQRDLEEKLSLQVQLQEAKRRLHELEYREFEFESTKRQRDIVLKENERLQMRLGGESKVSRPPGRDAVHPSAGLTFKPSSPRRSVTFNVLQTQTSSDPQKSMLPNENETVTRLGANSEGSVHNDENARPGSSASVASKGMPVRS